MSESPQFTNPEQELEYLEKRIQQIRESKESGPDAPLEKEDVSQAIEEHVAQVSDIEVPEDAVDPFQGMDGHEEQIKELVARTFQKGVLHAVRLARALNDPHLLKEFHNALVDRFHEKLVATGNIRTEHAE